MNCLMQAWHDNEGELRGWLRKRLGNPVDAEGALQELFLKALRQGEHAMEAPNSAPEPASASAAQAPACRPSP